MDLSISIVNTSNWTFLKPCLESIYTNIKNISFEILVVDNVSDDGSSENIRVLFPDVILTRNAKRHGFAKNNNFNLQKASGRYLMLLNDDTLMLPGTIEKAIEVMDQNPEIGMLGCKMICPDGEYQKASARKFRTLLSELIIETGLFRLFPQIYITPGTELTEVDMPSEAGMMVRREVVNEVGLLDDRFFMFGEGADWCRRIKAAGWKIVYYAGCPVIHFGGTTNKRSSLKMYVQFYKSTYLFFQKESRFKSAVYRGLLMAVFGGKKVLLWVGAKISPGNKAHYEEMKPYYDAMLDYLLNRFHDADYPYPA